MSNATFHFVWGVNYTPSIHISNLTDKRRTELYLRPTVPKNVSHNI